MLLTFLLESFTRLPSPINRKLYSPTWNYSISSSERSSPILDEATARQAQFDYHRQS